ncbi:MAG TPA: DUF2927 domain-containing protein [Halomicronema sp.]
MFKPQPFIFAFLTLFELTFLFSVKGCSQPLFVKQNSVFTPSPNFSFLSTKQIDYFLEVAMGSEFSQSNSVVRKWQGDIKVQVIGTPTPEDITTLVQVMNEVNFLAEGNINLRFDNQNSHIKIYFVPEREFANYESNYQPVNYGFFWTYWNNNQVITKANILITTENVTQRERSHLIREELTQSLGLMRDSYRYDNSIFYQGWTDVNEYSPIDKVLIQTLYRPQIKPGMSQEQVRQVLRSLIPPQNPQQPLTHPLRN